MRRPFARGFYPRAKGDFIILIPYYKNNGRKILEKSLFVCYHIKKFLNIF